MTRRQSHTCWHRIARSNLFFFPVLVDRTFSFPSSGQYSVEYLMKSTTASGFRFSETSRSRSMTRRTRSLLFSESTRGLAIDVSIRERTGPYAMSRCASSIYATFDGWGADNRQSISHLDPENRGKIYVSAQDTNAQFFHSDAGSDVVGLMAVSLSGHGGASTVVSVGQVYNHLAIHRPDIVRLLAEKEFRWRAYVYPPTQIGSCSRYLATAYPTMGCS